MFKIGRNDLCWCGSTNKYKNCHFLIDEKINFYKSKGHVVPSRDIIKKQDEIEGIKKSAKINITVLDYISEYISPGITTEEINKMVNEKTKELGGIPAPLNYMEFTKSVCTSINDQVCHGIPSDAVVLKSGDIINIDASTIYKGFYSDSSRMFCIGDVSSEKRKLVEVAKECVELGLQQVRPWGFLGDVGYAINECATKNNYSVVREIGGHGIGLEFHEDPWVGYVTQKGTKMLMVPGMIFTIEPMINMGSHKVYTNKKDGWTVYTEDGLPSAQWEYTVLVTDTGYEVLAY